MVVLLPFTLCPLKFTWCYSCVGFKKQGGTILSQQNNYPPCFCAFATSITKSRCKRTACQNKNQVPLFAKSVRFYPPFWAVLEYSKTLKPFAGKGFSRFSVFAKSVRFWGVFGVRQAHLFYRFAGKARYNNQNLLFISFIVVKDCFKNNAYV